MTVYEACPALESDRYLLRLCRHEDVDDLLKVYGDRNALPFFNSIIVTETISIMRQKKE